MAIDNRIAKALVIGIAGLVSIVVNPNFEAKDFTNPHRYVIKMNEDKEYRKSGLIYATSAAALYGALVGGAYSVLTKKR